MNWKALRDRYACPCDESPMYDKFILPTRGEGIWVWVEDDEQPYMDLVMGYSSTNFGHCHPKIVEAVCQATTQLSQIHSFHTKEKLQLSQYLSDAINPATPYQVYFDIGGTSVVAAALRICRSYTGKKTIICFEGAFHGTNYLSASVTDDALLNKAEYGIDYPEDAVVKVPFPAKHGNFTTDSCIEQIEQAIAQTQPAALIVEPIQGAAGFIIPYDDFLPRLRKITADAGVLLILDEIQMGVGRTGYLYAHQRWGIQPDIVLLSKSLAGGYYPLSAIIARPELFARIPARSTAFQSTFNNNPFAIRIALRTLEIAEQEKLFAQAEDKGNKLLQALHFIEDSPHLHYLRGIGLAIAFDVTHANAPDQPNPELAHKLVHLALDEHFITYRCGVHRNIIKLSPPLTISDAEMAEAVKRLHKVISQLDSIK